MANADLKNMLSSKNNREKSLEAKCIELEKRMESQEKDQKRKEFESKEKILEKEKSAKKLRI